MQFCSVSSSEIERKRNPLFLIPRCEMLIAEPVGQLRSLHWRSASQLHRRSSCSSTCVNSTTIYCIDRSKRPTFYRLFAAPPLYSLFFALAVLALIRPCSACEIVDLPQSSYSFSECFGGCATAGNTHHLIKLDSVQAWSAPVRLSISSEMECHFPASRINMFCLCSQQFCRRMMAISG